MDIKYQHKTPGLVKAIQAAEGDTVAVGQAFAVVEEKETRGEKKKSHFPLCHLSLTSPTNKSRKVKNYETNPAGLLQR